MKRIASLRFLLLFLLVAALVQPAISATTINTGKGSTLIGEPSSLTLDQDEEIDYFEGEAFPILIEIVPDNGGDTIDVKRVRNDTIGEGAIIRVGEHNNVTFRYAVAFSNETEFNADDYDFKLYADLPLVNETDFNNTGINPALSFTDGEPTLSLEYTNTNTTDLLDYALPYDNSLIIQNATLYYFEAEFEVNVTSQYIPFFAQDDNPDGLSEAPVAYNLLTTETYWNTSSVDEFYIQNEIVNITASIFMANTTDEFGVSFRTSTNGGSFTTFVDRNVTTIEGNFSQTLVFSDYEPVTQFEWYSYAIVNDTLTNVTREIQRVEYKSVEIGDGTPELVSEIFSDHKDERLVTTSELNNGTLYTQSYSVTFNASSFVSKGNISQFYVIPNTGEASIDFPRIGNQTYEDELSLTYDYSTLVTDEAAGGMFNATVYVETDKSLTLSLDYTIVVDQTKPTLTLNIADGSSTVITETGEVEFEFSFSDDRSGVFVAFIDFGDDTSQEVTSQTTVTHRYSDVGSERSYQIELTVIDRAGNVQTFGSFVTVQIDTLDEFSGPTIEFYIFLFGVVLLFVFYRYAQQVYDVIRDQIENIRN